MPKSAVVHARPLEETAFLVEAAAQTPVKPDGWSDQVLSVLDALEAKARSERLDTQTQTAI